MAIENELERLRLALDQYRAETERQRGAIEHQRLEVEKDRANLERERAALERYRVTHEAKRPLVEAVMRFADLSVRSLLILNGGAALAILTYAANATRAGSTYGEQLASGVWIFGLGAFMSVATAGLAYIAQVLFTEPTSPKARWGAEGVRGFAIAVGIASWAAFGCGMYQASVKLASIQSQSTPVTAVPAIMPKPQLPTLTPDLK